MACIHLFSPLTPADINLQSIRLILSLHYFINPSIACCSWAIINDISMILIYSRSHSTLGWVSKPNCTHPLHALPSSVKCLPIMSMLLGVDTRRATTVALTTPASDLLFRLVASFDWEIMHVCVRVALWCSCRFSQRIGVRKLPGYGI